MRIFTSLAKRALMLTALAAATSFAAFSADPVIAVDGLVYKITKGEAQMQKATTTLTTGEKVAPYAGDIVVPNTITYQGTEYPVTKVASSFKATNITSIKFNTTKLASVDKGGFMGCPELVSVELPAEGFTKLAGNTFQNCEKLEKIVVPGTITSFGDQEFGGCIALKDITFTDGPAMTLKKTLFNGCEALENVTILRALSTSNTDADYQPFRNLKSLKKVTLGGTCTSLNEYYFMNCPNLTEVDLGPEFASFGNSCFAQTGITSIVLPATLKSINGGTFMSCTALTEVAIPEGVTSIGDQAFKGAGIKKATLPSTLTSIGISAFANTPLEGALVLPATVKSLGNQAYANCTGLNKVAFSSALATLGEGVFVGCDNIAALEVEGNETFVVKDGNTLTDAAATTVYYYAPASTPKSFAGAYTTVAPYAFYNAKNVETIELPSCVNWGAYSFYGAGLKKAAVVGNAGRFAFAGTPINEASFAVAQVPMGIVANCAELAKVDFLRPITVIQQEAFANTTKLESLNLGNILAILEGDCFKGSALKNITVGSFYPAAMTEGVFTEGSEITVTVPESLVDAYKAAEGWKFLTVKGDANVAVGGETMGMPDGLYYAGCSGKNGLGDLDLHCIQNDGAKVTYPVGLEHMFQLAQFSHRIYLTSAGRKFWYEGTASGTAGDGKLAYISRIGDEVFSATVFDNTGFNAYADPTGLYINGEYLYVNDRNVAIRKIAASALALPSTYPSWMENNWMCWYDANWTYGCIKNGFAITTDDDETPRYWVGMKYNGFGIFSFKESNIGSSAGKGSDIGTEKFLCSINPIITSFNIDEKNNHLYFYLEFAGGSNKYIPGGLYRVGLDELRQCPDPTIDQFFDELGVELIDGAPVAFEGNATNEHIAVSQLAIDDNGEYMYWCYRAPTQAEADARVAACEDMATAMTGGQYPWADTFDAENPLHQTGIKRIKLGEANPVVEMVAPGAEGYGVVPVNYVYDPNAKPEGVEDAVSVADNTKVLALVGGQVVANADVTVNVFNAAGILLGSKNVAAGSTVALDEFNGVLVLTANGQALKVVK